MRHSSMDLVASLFSSMIILDADDPAQWRIPIGRRFRDRGPQTITLTLVVQMMFPLLVFLTLPVRFP